MASGFEVARSVKTGRLTMHFMTLLRSLDEFLYDLMSWVAFFPVTLWRIITAPLTTMRRAQTELELPSEAQFRSLVAPPIMLVLCILLSQGIGLAVDGPNAIVARHTGLAGLIDDNLTLLLMRIVLFANFALVMAATKVIRSSEPYDRDTLKGPFYAQCYAAAPFALASGLVSTAVDRYHSSQTAEMAGAATLLLVPTIYGTLQIFWFRRELNQRLVRSIIDASIAMIGSLAIFGVVVYFVAG